MPGWTLNLTIALALLACQGHAIGCQQNRPTQWLAGEKLVKASTSPTFSMTWMEAELRTELQMASRNTGIAVLVDRRLDPGQKISLALQNVSFEQFLWNIAEQSGAGVIRLDTLYYLAPPETIATIQQRLRNLENASNHPGLNPLMQKALQRRIPVRSELPFEPQALISGICKDCGIPVRGLELIPHDFWAPIDLPHTKIPEIVSILVAGFKLEITVSENGDLSILPAIQPDTVEFRIPRDVSARADLSRVQAIDGIALDKRDGIDVIAGKPEPVFAAIRELAQSAPHPGVANHPGSREVLSLHVKASRGSIAATVAQLLQVRLVYSETEKAKLDAIVEINVDKVSADELLETCLKGSGLEFTISETELRIHPGRQ